MILRDLTHVLHSISSHCPAPCFRVRPGSYILSMRYLLCNLSVLSMWSLHAYLLLLMLTGGAVHVMAASAGACSL